MKGYSESTFSKLWRKAVLLHNGYKCFICGVSAYDEKAENLQCHHIVYRRHKITKWNYRNGIPLCENDHKWMHSNVLKSNEYLKNNLYYYEYLKELEHIIYKQYLIDNGITDNDFKQKQKQELLRIIKGCTDFE